MDLVSDIAGKNVIKWAFKTVDFLFTKEEISSCVLVPSTRTETQAADPEKVAMMRAAMIEKYGYETVKADAVWAIIITKFNGKGRSLKYMINQQLKSIVGR